MREIRKGQAERHKEISGGIFLEPRQEAAINPAIQKSHLVQSVSETGQMAGAVFRTARLFEEMCRRQHVDIGDSMRSWVVRLLATELLVNQNALPEAAQDRLETLTALQGGIGPELVKEFGERFKHSRSYFNQAAGHASNPREHLQAVAQPAEQKRRYEKKSPYWSAEVKRTRKSKEASQQSLDKD